jgi:hypothetical protein
MPQYVFDLIKLQLCRMGLELEEPRNDLVGYPIMYENGTVLVLLIMCISERGWFNQEKPMIVVSIASVDDNTRAVKAYTRETIAVPTTPNDVGFMIRIAALIRASAWSIASSAGIGECVTFPGRPQP